MDNSAQMIQKGKIVKLEEPLDRNGDHSRARVMPNNAEGVVTRPITIPWWLRGRMGLLVPEDEVAYALFEDGTGVILSRMDGEWPGEVPGDVTLHGSYFIDDNLEVQKDTMVEGEISITGETTIESNVNINSETTIKGDLALKSDLITDDAPSYLKHKHGGITSGSSKTATPE